MDTWNEVASAIMPKYCRKPVIPLLEQMLGAITEAVLAH